MKKSRSCQKRIEEKGNTQQQKYIHSRDSSTKHVTKFPQQCYSFIQWSFTLCPVHFSDIVLQGLFTYFNTITMHVSNPCIYSIHGQDSVNTV